MTSSRFEGKVALISGAARGQGREHAVRFAREGADIIAFDICRQLDSVPYPMSTPADLEETVRLVEATGRRIVAGQVDSRDTEAVDEVMSRGLRALGRVDVVVANAGIGGFTENAWSTTDDQWEEMIGVNLTGVWKTLRAAIPAMIDGGRGGSIVLTSSAAGLKATPGNTHYCAAKHGLVGLMRSVARELGEHSIRVNTVHPAGVDTPMIANTHTSDYMAAHPDLAAATTSTLPIRILDSSDIADAVLWLCSDEARHVTAICLPIDAGLTQR
jgi:SDR family mycofactocin-dependent oxidoreductase